LGTEEKTNFKKVKAVANDSGVSSPEASESD